MTQGRSRRTQMDGQPMSTTNREILFDKRNYSSWRERMKGYFKTKGPVVTGRQLHVNLPFHETKKNWDNAHLLKNYVSSYRISIMLK